MAQTPTQNTETDYTSPDILRPLPIRITQRQYLRLVAHRAIDSLAIQEHIRRAIDAYLDDLDLKRPNERVARRAKAGHVVQATSKPEPEASVTKAAPSRLVFR